MQDNSRHGLWKGNLSFILIATGSTVGLGNIWRFPYIAGENGGSAFMLVYLVSIFLIGLPLIMAEIMIGRKARANPIDAVGNLAKENKSTGAWSIVGIMSLLSGFLILTFYAVIAGWSIEYLLDFVLGAFKETTTADAGKTFNDFLKSPSKLIIWATVIIFATMLIVGLGVKKGLEKNINWMMPGLVVLLLVILGYSMASGSFIEGFKFLFAFDSSKISADSFLAALGQAFFTLSLAAGAIIAYGAYLPRESSIPKVSFTVVLSDTFIAIIAGLAIFPLVFANGLNAGEGPGLLFVTLTTAFSNMPFGSFFGFLFFAMLTIAALTSSISMIEASMAFCIERFKWSRVKSAIVLGVIVWFLSLGTVFSFNYWSEFKIFGKTIFDSIDYLTSSILMPLGGMFMAIFVGWILPKKISKAELNLGTWFGLWFNTIRFVTPLLIIIVFLSKLGFIG